MDFVQEFGHPLNLIHKDGLGPPPGYVLDYFFPEQMGSFGVFQKLIMMQEINLPDPMAPPSAFDQGTFAGLPCPEQEKRL
jgi:hypothetical protein